MDLIKISHWFVANQLIINESKTKFMVFCGSNKLYPTVLPPNCINNALINIINSLTFLEVVLYVYLNFMDNLPNVTKIYRKSFPSSFVLEST